MSRKRSLWISLACALLAGALVLAVYELQLRQLEGATQVAVVVPVKFIDAGVMIKEDMIEFRFLESNQLLEGTLTHMEQVIGQEALIPLGAGEPVLDWKLDRLQLMPNSDQATFQIPKSYILSISSGIRAGDQVAIYVSSGASGSKRLFSNDVTVASVKSSSYTEVDDDEHSALLSRARDNQEKLYAARRDASAPIDHVNVNLTEEQWLLLDQWCQDGQAKLVIAYAGMVTPDVHDQ